MKFILYISAMRNIPSTENYVIFLNKAATGTGTAFPIQQFKDLMLSLDTSGSADMTIKIQVSNQLSQPDFSASQSASNQWAYAEIQNIDDHALIAGGTGIVASGTDLHKMYSVVPKGPFRWLCATITARSAGTLTQLALTPSTDTLS